MNKIMNDAFNRAKAETIRAGSFIPVNRVLEILETLKETAEAVDRQEGGGADFTDEDKKWLQDVSDRGLTLDLKENGVLISYTVLFQGMSVGAGSISNEGLDETALNIKIMKLIDAENILQTMERMYGEEVQCW